MHASAPRPLAPTSALLSAAPVGLTSARLSAAPFTVARPQLGRPLWRAPTRAPTSNLDYKPLYMARPIRAPKALALTLATRPSRCALYGASRLGRLIGPRPYRGRPIKARFY
jgi:hypothetical protein